jgi:16S rRNA A1518/A1519 N6-dimethyltransferase RsmA/KsgA/DIM1 with predicted DNA glycosylase/AP lyase activity
LRDDLEVTAVELDPELARMYQERFPNDIVIVADAHQYLLDHYKEFDFIWSSPPFPTHSRIQTSFKNRETWKPKYPDMKLYEEIIFLRHFFEGKYCIENVIPYNVGGYRDVLRNLVDYEAGKTILQTALGMVPDSAQADLFSDDLY